MNCRPQQQQPRSPLPQLLPPQSPKQPWTATRPQRQPQLQLCRGRHWTSKKHLSSAVLFVVVCGSYAFSFSCFVAAAQKSTLINESARVESNGHIFSGCTLVFSW